MLIFVSLAFLALLICIIRLFVEMPGKTHGGNNPRADTAGEVAAPTAPCATMDCPMCKGTGKIDVK